MNAQAQNRHSPLLYLVLVGLYVSQGLPYGFFTQALPVYLRQSGQSLALIGASSLLALPWATKFMIAPFVDHFSGGALGPRKSWIVPLQIGSLLLTSALGISALLWSTALGPVPILLLGVGFLICNAIASVQDVATDAFAIEQTPKGWRGLINTIQVSGYRLGMLIGGAALLSVIADLGLGTTLLLMSLVLGLALLPLLFFTESKQTLETTRPQVRPAPFTLREWWNRLIRIGQGPAGPSWLCVLLLFKFFHQGSVTMLRPYLVDQGLSLSEVAKATGLVGTVSGLVGSVSGGLLLRAAPRLGSFEGLGLLTALQFIATSSIVISIWVGFEPQSILIPISLDALVSGIATVVLFTSMMGRTVSTNTGSDYAVQASLIVISQVLASFLSGILAQAIGLRLFFTVHMGIGFLFSGVILYSLNRLNQLAGSKTDSFTKEEF